MSLDETTTLDEYLRRSRVELTNRVSEIAGKVYASGNPGLITSFQTDVLGLVRGYRDRLGEDRFRRIVDSRTLEEEALMLMEETGEVSVFGLIERFGYDRCVAKPMGRRLIPIKKAHQWVASGIRSETVGNDFRQSVVYKKRADDISS